MATRGLVTYYCYYGDVTTDIYVAIEIFHVIVKGLARSTEQIKK